MQKLHIGSANPVNFGTSQDVAKTEAHKLLTDPMVLSWKNLHTGEHSPNVDCCGHDGKEAWEIYDESRGGTLRV